MFVKILLVMSFVFLPSMMVQANPSSFAPLVKKTLPAVVRILSESPAKNSFAENTQKKSKGKAQGSGFIFKKGGYVLTNNHVVNSTKKIIVVLENGKKYTAKIIGIDPLTDIAVLKLNDAKGTLPILKLGDSDATQVGDWVIAVGNPLNLGTTVTKGIISARGRNIQTGLYDDYLQTDAPINKGNSGGPLINMRGEVIGINTVIISSTGANIGLGFAIPSSIIKKISDELLKYGVVKRGWLGIGLKDASDENSSLLGAGDIKGVVLNSVEKGSPADKAGMKIEDAIISFNGKKITYSKRLPALVAHAPVGKNLPVEIIRNGKLIKIFVKLTERKNEISILDSSSSNALVEEVELKGSGISVANLTANFRKQYNISNAIKGVLILNIKKNYKAYHIVPEISVIERINNVPVRNITDVKNLVKFAHKQGKPNLLLQLSTAKETRLFITVTLSK